MANGYLEHFGVKGMHWGVWNDETRRRRLGLHSRFGGGSDISTAKSGSNKKHGLTDRQKTALKIAVGVAVVAAVGGVSIYAAKKHGLILPKGKKAVDQAMKSVGPDHLLPEGGIGFESNLPRCAPNMSMKEHIARVNPLHGAWGHGDNCTSCTTALEMRLRGYDVEAIPMESGTSIQNVAKAFKNAEYHDPFGEVFGHDRIERIMTIEDPKKRTNATIKMMALNPGKTVEYAKLTQERDKQTYADLMKLPDGARGNFCGVFSGGGGHSIFFQKENGKLNFYDGQTGERYHQDAKTLLESATNHRWMRTDNLEVDWSVMQDRVRAHNSYYDTMPAKNRYFSINEDGVTDPDALKKQYKIVTAPNIQ